MSYQVKFGLLWVPIKGFTNLSSNYAWFGGLKQGFSFKHLSLRRREWGLGQGPMVVFSIMGVMWITKNGTNVRFLLSISFHLVNFLIAFLCARIALMMRVFSLDCDLHRFSYGLLVELYHCIYQCPQMLKSKNYADDSQVFPYLRPQRYA